MVQGSQIDCKVEGQAGTASNPNAVTSNHHVTLGNLRALSNDDANERPNVETVRHTELDVRTGRQSTN